MATTVMFGADTVPERSEAGAGSAESGSSRTPFACRENAVSLPGADTNAASLPDAQPQLFHVLIQQSPFRSALIDCTVETGCTLAELGANEDVFAFVNGARELNLGYRPALGEVVLLRQTVAGGDNGKAALAIIATAVLAAASYGTSLYVQGATGSVLAGFAAGAAVGIVGGLAINALIPPPSQSLDLGGFNGGAVGSARNSNQAIPYGVVPRLYGTDRIYPPLGALPYTETQGEAQYVVMRFCLGYAPMQKDEASLRIGTTALTDFGEDTEHEFFDGTTGSARDVPIYARNTIEESLAIALDSNGDSAIRTTVAATREVSLDFVAPTMIVINEEGKRRTCAVALKVEYKPSSGSTWTVVSSAGDFEADGAAVYPPENFTTHFPWTTAGTPGTGTGLVKDSTNLGGGPYPPSSGPAVFIIGRDSKPFRVGIRFKTPSAGSYDVRVTRIAGYIFSGDNWFPIDDPVTEEPSTKVLWTALRSMGQAAASTLRPGLEYLDLRIRLTNQLGGVVNRLSLVASSILPTWSAGSWVDAVTNNPAWVYRDALTGSANSEPVPLPKVDDDTFKAWAADNAAAGLAFNGTFDRELTVYDALRAIASCGRGAFQIRDGLHSVVRDRPGISRSQVFSNRNSWSYKGSRVFVVQPHAIKARFRDAESDYAEVERIVYADGYSEAGAGGTTVATRFEELKLFGVTSRDQAWKDTRFHMAQAKLRAEQHQLWADIDNLICQRGDVVGLAQPAALIGIGSARIKSVAGSTLTTDETFTLASGSKEVLFRKDNNTFASGTTTTSGTTNTLTISGGVPGGVAAGDLIMVGTPLDVLITHIEYNDDLQAQITAVPYSSPAVHNADSGTIPDFDPAITLPQETPPEPIIISAVPRERRTSAGDKIPRVPIVYRLRRGDVPVARVLGRFREVDDIEWEVLDARAPSGVYTIEVPSADAIYEVGVAALSIDDIPSTFANALVDFRFEVAGELGPLTLTEQPDTPDTRNGRLTTIHATVVPPTDPTRYSHALFEYRKAGHVAWTEIGPSDAGHHAAVVVRADGQEYEVRARGVSTTGEVNLNGPSAFITITDNTGAPTDDTGPTHSGLNVTNLRIRGQLPSVNDYTGSPLRLEWDAPVAGLIPAGHRLDDYRVRIKHATTGVLLHQSRETRARFDYSPEQNADDCTVAGYAGPLRDLAVEVIARSDLGWRSASAATKTVTKLVPTLPADSHFKGLKTSIRHRFSRPVEGGNVLVREYASLTSGFVPDPTPDTGNLVYDGVYAKPVLIPDLAAGVWYVRAQLGDEFGYGTIAAEVAVTVNADAVADTTPPTTPGPLTLTSEVGDADQVTNVTLKADWGASTDDSGQLRYELEVWRTDKPTQIWTRNTKNQSAAFPNALAGFNYSGRARAIDAALNESAWTATATHTAVGDTTAPPNVSDFTATPKIGKVAVRWRNPPKSSARDWFETDLHWGASAGFTPDPADSSTSRIYRGPGDRHVDHDAVVATPRYYKARTLDISGNASTFSTAIGPYSPTADDVPKDVTAPSVPTGVIMSSAVEGVGQVADVSLTVTWNQSVDPEGSRVRYEVDVWPTAAPTRVRTRPGIRDSGGATTSTTFEGVGPGRGYSSRVRAVDDAGNPSAYSTTATHTTAGDVTAPAAPTGLIANPKVGRINLKWANPNVGDFYRTTIERATNAGFTGAAVVFSGDVEAWTDNEVVAGTTYYYRPQAFDRSLNPSSYGTSASAAPVADDVVLDETAPPKPTGLGLTSTVEVSGVVADVTMQATWNQSIDPEGSPVYYNLEMWPTADASRIRKISRIPDSGAATTTVVFPGVGPGRNYTARVESQDEAGNTLGFTTTVSHTTATDAAAPAAPTGITAVFNTDGDCEIAWTNPSSANFRDVEVSVYGNSGFTTLLHRETTAAQALVFTAAQNRQAGSGTPDPTLFVRLLSRGFNGVNSATTVPAAQPVKALPANVTGLTQSWSGDTGGASADMVMTWNAASGASLYRLTLDGVARDLVGNRYVYPLAQNRSEHSGTPDPVVSVSIVAVDPLDQVSATPATATATNAAPAAPSSVTITGYLSSVGIVVNGALPADGVAYRYRLIQSSPSAADVTWEGSSTLRTREVDVAATYQVGVKIVDAFGQASAETLSGTVAVDTLTLADLRKYAIYSDSAGNSEATLAALDDNVLGSGGVSYASAAGWTRWVQMRRELIDRYRTVTLSMAPASGTSNWYLRTSLDGVSWQYFSGPVAGSTITSVASASAAQTAAISSATLGNGSNSRVDLPSIVEARYVELFLRNTGASTTVREFYPRRLVQSDDVEAQAIKALHISVASLSAISAQLGAVHVDGDVDISAGGAIWSGKPVWTNQNPGFWFGVDAGVAKFHIGTGNANTGKYIQWDGTTLAVQGEIRTAKTGQRVELTSGGETEFYDEFGSLAASIGINPSGSDYAYILAGFNGTGNATQKDRIGVAGYSDTRYGVFGVSTSDAGVFGISDSNEAVRGISGTGDGVFGLSGAAGNGVTGFSTTSGKGVFGKAASGPGVYGTYTSAAQGNGIGGSVNSTDRAAGVFEVGSLGTDSVGIAARANYAAVAQQNSTTLGAALLLKANTSSGAAPSHTAECGSFAPRYPSGNLKLYLQEDGDLHGTGIVWKEIYTGFRTVLASAFASTANTNALETVLTLTIPANTLTAGTTLRLAAAGAQSQSANTNDVEFVIAINGTTLVTSGVATPATAQTDRAVFFAGSILFPAVGSGGTVTGGAMTQVSGELPGGDANVSSASVNTTSAVTVAMRVRNSRANASNVIKVRSASIAET